MFGSYDFHDEVWWSYIHTVPTCLPVDSCYNNAQNIYLWCVRVIRLALFSSSQGVSNAPPPPPPPHTHTHTPHSPPPHPPSAAYTRQWIRSALVYEAVFFVGCYLKTYLASNGNICVTGSLCGEFTSRRWITLTKTNDAELWCFLWSAPELTVK